MTLFIPPIKCQGIKTKLVPFIQEKIPSFSGVWYEPFMGSGVVGFNVQPKKAIFSDTNPHIIKFYNDIKNEIISSAKVKEYLEDEGKKLLENGDLYYKQIRARFNSNPNSFDFLFLNRSCFNGMMRFNSKGFFNVPFCKKNNRFAKSYITKISNQVKNITNLLADHDYSFICDSFENIISKTTAADFLYCDPPYIDRYSDYFNGWTTLDEDSLFTLLKNTKAQFLLSTWHHNKYRENIYIQKYWNNFTIYEKTHFYHLGAKENNRNTMIEALVSNF